jgi:hypothetical protein
VTVAQTSSQVLGYSAHPCHYAMVDQHLVDHSRRSSPSQAQVQAGGQTLRLYSYSSLRSETAILTAGKGKGKARCPWRARMVSGSCRGSRRGVKQRSRGSWRVWKTGCRSSSLDNSARLVIWRSGNGGEVWNAYKARASPNCGVHCIAPVHPLCSMRHCTTTLLSHHFL